MPKGLYFTAVVFSPFCSSTPNLWSHWTDVNQTWTYIHLWLLFIKFGPNSPGIYPRQVEWSGLGGKPLSWDRLWNLAEQISETKNDINNRIKTSWIWWRADRLVRFWASGWAKLTKIRDSLLGRRWTALHDFTPLALSSAAKPVTVQTNKHTQTVNDISTPSYRHVWIQNQMLVIASSL